MSEIDLSKTITPKSDQMNADDLIVAPRTIKITGVSVLVNPDQPVSINFEGDGGKPYKPCKSMRRLMVFVWGEDGKKYVGKSMTLYRDPTVKFGGDDVGGIRISHMSDISEPLTFSLTATKGKRKPYRVLPLVVEKAKPIDPAVKEAGDKAAAGGVNSYTQWKDSLSPEVKETIKPYHSGWAAIAKEADANKQTAPASDNPPI